MQAFIKVGATVKRRNPPRASGFARKCNVDFRMRIRRHRNNFKYTPNSRLPNIVI